VTLRRWLRDRRLPAAIVLVALAAGASQLLLWWLGPAPRTHTFVGPPRSAYTLIDAKVIEYGLDGKPGLHMQSPRVERREGDDSLYLNAPTFQMPAKQPGIPDWQGQSLYGWVNKPGTVLKLQGAVSMQRPGFTDTHGTAQPEASLHTSNATVWPRENRMETAEPVQMAQGDRRMSGVGMRANLNDNHLELLDDSHGSFPPRKH
jgi:lipopolysaccharide export system protein LptC